MKLKWNVGMRKLCSMHIIDVIRDLKKRNTHTKNIQFSFIVISSLVGVLFCVCECVRHAVLSLQRRWWWWQHVPLSPIENVAFMFLKWKWWRRCYWLKIQHLFLNSLFFCLDEDELGIWIWHQQPNTRKVDDWKSSFAWVTIEFWWNFT